MHQISRTAFLAAGIALIAVPSFAQGGSPAAAAPAQATTAPAQRHTQARPVTPANPGGSATVGAQAGSATGTTAQRPATTATPRAAATPAAPHAAAATTTPHAAATTATPRTDQRSQATPATPAPVRTN